MRKILIELRDEILNKIAQEMGSKLDEDPRISTLSPMDIGELSQLDLDEGIDYTLLNMHIARLREVEDALDRLEEGTYGICEDCVRHGYQVGTVEGPSLLPRAVSGVRRNGSRWGRGASSNR